MKSADGVDRKSGGHWLACHDASRQARTMSFLLLGTTLPYPLTAIRHLTTAPMLSTTNSCFPTLTMASANNVGGTNGDWGGESYFCASLSSPCAISPTAWL